MKHNVLTHRLSLLGRRHASVLRRAADQLGLLYFGSVDQHDDEHDAIRGIISSLTHRDSHYASGTYDDYDIAFVDRLERGECWFILRVDFHHHTTIPRALLIPHNEKTYFADALAAHRRLRTVPLNHGELRNRFELSLGMSDQDSFSEFVNQETQNIIAARVWPHTIEFEGRSLYLYVRGAEISSKQLDAIIDTGLTIARSIDRVA